MTDNVLTVFTIGNVELGTYRAHLTSGMVGAPIAVTARFWPAANAANR